MGRGECEGGDKKEGDGKVWNSKKGCGKYEGDIEERTQEIGQVGRTRVAEGADKIREEKKVQLAAENGKVTGEKCTGE